MTIYYKDGFFDDTDGGFVPESSVKFCSYFLLGYVKISCRIGVILA